MPGIKNKGGAYAFGLIIGLPGFIVVAKAFNAIVPAITAGLGALL